MDSTDERYLHQLYYNPKYRTAFSGANKLWQYIKLHGKNITKKQLYEWLSKQDIYTSHHPIIHRFARKRVVTRGLNDVWDVDLMDMSNLAKYNQGVTFIAIFIDIFSRYLYVESMKNKSTAETLKAIKMVFTKSKQQPETFRSDAGKEFLGKEVKQYLVDREIYQQITRNDTKANYAERVIRTLKKKFYRYLYHNKTHKYIDVLQSLVDGYNENYHSRINCAPSMINKENEAQVWAKQYLPKKSVKVKEIKFKFSPGNLVHISNVRTPFSCGFGQTFSEEIFKIRYQFGTVPTTYILEDLNKDKVSGLFYEPELVLVRGQGKDAEYQVEKILEERIRKGQKQVLIKWKRYPETFNSWEPIKNLV